LWLAIATRSYEVRKVKVWVHGTEVNVLFIYTLQVRIWKDERAFIRSLVVYETKLRLLSLATMPHCRELRKVRGVCVCVAEGHTRDPLLMYRLVPSRFCFYPSVKRRMNPPLLLSLVRSIVVYDICAISER
ncbi:hypothetical protein Tcan_04055, partial [Toxocara canis]